MTPLEYILVYVLKMDKMSACIIKQVKSWQPPKKLYLKFILSSVLFKIF